VPKGRIKVKDRIVEFIRVPAKDLLANPENWRTHPQKQRAAFQSILREVGVADVLLAYRKQGKLMLIDGHMRREELEALGNVKVPVLVLDVNDAEAQLLLATVDPLGDLATSDRKKHGKLLSEVRAEEDATIDLLNVSAAQHKAQGVSKRAQAVSGPAKLDPDTVEPSKIRMVQLFLDGNNIKEFNKMIAHLKPVFGDAVTNVTEVIYEAVRRCYAAAGGAS
jgi:hypothetical protein